MGCCHCGNSEEALNLDLEIEKEKRVKKLESLRASNTVTEQSSAFKVRRVSDPTKKGTLTESVGNDCQMSLFIKTNLRKEINAIRSNPPSYVTKLEKFMSQVSSINNSNVLSVNHNSFKIERGKEIFVEAINVLKNTKSEFELSIDNNLLIPFPNEGLLNFDHDKYLKEEITKVKDNFGDRYERIEGYCEKSVSDTEFVAVMGLTNMNTSEDKRGMILDGNFDKIAISVKKIDEINNVYCYYIVFGKERFDEF